MVSLITPLLLFLSLSMTAKRVKNFFLHPKFNISAKVNEGVKEFYDYDVALIQLTEFVKISTMVRYDSDSIVI